MFHNFFIPHKDNKHKPHALRKRRILFHALSAIVIKCFVIVVVGSLPLTAWLTTDVIKLEEERIVELSNSERNAQGVESLIRNPLLDLTAEEKAYDMLENQYFAHEDENGTGIEYFALNKDYNYSVIGENLALGYNNAVNVVSAWKDSPTHYQNIIDSEYSEFGVAIVNGYYNDIETSIIVAVYGAPAVNGYFNEIVELYDKTKTVLMVENVKHSTAQLLTAEIYSDENPTVAQISYKGEVVDLYQSEKGKWLGYKVFNERLEGNKQNIVIPAVLAVKTKSGEEKYTDIAVAGITPDRNSILDRYTFIKDSASPLTNRLLGISNFYLQIILAISIFALFAYVLFSVKKHEKHLILPVSGLITLLFILILL